MVNTLVQQKLDLTKHKDLLQSQLTNLAQAKVKFEEKLGAAKLELGTQERETQRLQAELAGRKAVSEEANERKAEISEELLELRAKIEQQNAEIELKKQQLTDQRKVMKDLENSVKGESEKVGDGRGAIANFFRPLVQCIYRRDRLFPEICPRLREADETGGENQKNHKAGPGGSESALGAGGGDGGVRGAHQAAAARDTGLRYVVMYYVNPCVGMELVDRMHV